MTYKEISEEFGVSVSALKRHAANHLPRYVRLTAKINMLKDNDGATKEAIRVPVDGERIMIWLDPYLKWASKKFHICETDEQIAAGKVHAAAVRKHYDKMGEPERWKELVSLVESEWPGFRVIQ